MKKWIAICALALAPLVSSAAIVYEGDLGDSAVHNGSLPSESGWVQSNGAAVDFWSFTAAAGETISLMVNSSATDIAFSLFSGTPDDVTQAAWFVNDGDWDLFEFLTLSSNPGDEALLDFLLPSSGVFTLAIGGEVPDFLANDDLAPFGYSVQLTRATAAVPLPATLWLLVPGVVGLAAARRRQESLVDVAG